MTNRELCEYLFTQDPDAEVIAFDGHRHMQIYDVYDTELQLNIKDDEEQ